MPKSQLHVANIVATSTPEAWAQTYHAGGVTAIIAVCKKSGSTSSQNLSVIGKDLLNTFESEYFTLATKNLSSIKQAVEATVKEAQETHNITFILTSVIQNAVYLVLAGAGKVLLVRGNTLATLLQQEEGEEVISASGFLEPEDVMVLETLPFSQKVPSSMLLETLTTSSVENAAEAISPTVHAQVDGSLAALFFSFEETQSAFPYTTSVTAKEAPAVKKEEEKADLAAEEKEESSKEPAPFISKEEKEINQFDFAQIPTETKESEEAVAEDKPEEAVDTQEVTPKSQPEEKKEILPQDQIPVFAEKKRKKGITHMQRLSLTIAVILIIVFVATGYFYLQKKQADKQVALFSSIYPAAQKKYDEGVGLKDLNTQEAHADFLSAQQMLQGAQNKFPQGSSEQKQINNLLAQISSQLSATPNIPNTQLTKVAASSDPLLGFAAAHTGAKYFVQDGTDYYTADTNGITRFTSSTGTGKQIIQSSWKSLGGFGIYFGNYYVLDSADGILKYSPSFSKSSYFTGNTPDLSKAVSMAIDGSVWILGNDGTIAEYTRGKQDTFTITGLSTPLSSPTQIVTSSDDNNLYVLDNGNSRLVEIKKDGTFVAQFYNPQLKSATQLDVLEKDGKAYVLIGQDIYEMALK